jgi:GNAT superfamily N-acetyltransferase
LEAADRAQAQALSAEAGWPHRVEDWEFVQRLGAGYGAHGRPGGLVGTALWWPFGDRYAAAGMVIVSRAARGRGAGRRLMQAILDDAGPRSIVLNSTREGQRLYESMGFRSTAAVCQHQGIARLPHGKPSVSAGPIRPIGEADLDRLLALDVAATGMERGEALGSLCRVGRGIALGRDGATVGYAFLRQFGRGYVVGPVVASDADVAVTLIDHWLRHYAGKFVRVDAPIPCDALSAWLARSGLVPVDTVTMMWRGTPPDAGRGVRVFGLINQALG